MDYFDVDFSFTATVADYNLLLDMNRIATQKYSDMRHVAGGISKSLADLNDRCKPIRFFPVCFLMNIDFESPIMSFSRSQITVVVLLFLTMSPAMMAHQKRMHRVMVRNKNLISNMIIASLFQTVIMSVSILSCCTRTRLYWLRYWCQRYVIVLC